MLAAVYREEPMRAVITIPAAVAATLLATGPAAANEFCDDLWFSRNQLYDRAGYCFSTPLGQAVFDNSDCIGKDVTLEPGGDALVAYIRDLEIREGCDVNTSGTTLEVANMDLRFELETVVARSEYASGCLGWQGPSLALTAGPRPGSPLLSTVEPGDDITWEYEPVGWPEGWEFITVYRDGVQIGLGWHPGQIDYDLCTNLAG
jgi:hypothetical protein